MDSPVRKMQKRNDYNRHKLFRKIRRRRRAQAELFSRIAEKELKKKLRVTPVKYDDGKATGYVRDKNDHPIAFDEEGNLVDQVTGDKGTMYVPEVTISPSRYTRDLYSSAFEGNQDKLMDMVSLAPIVGDAIDAYGVYNDLNKGDYLAAGIGTGMLALPNFIEKPVKGIGKLIRKAIKGDVSDIIDASKMFRWTPEQWTAAQDAAIARGNMTEAHRLRDLHFKYSAPNTKIKNLDGELAHIYHGTDANWVSYDPSKFGSATDDGYYGVGLYGTEYKPLAKGYGDNVMDLYINAEKPFVAGTQDIKGRPYTFENATDRGTVVRHFNRDRSKTDFSNAPVFGDTNFSTLFKELDNADAVVYGTPSQRFNEVVVPNGTQIKSADAVTYDDNGVRIPLGIRDNFGINNIRYGLIPFGMMGAGAYLNKHNGLLSSYKDGKASSGIHIKPSHRGRLTALKKRTGKSEAELYRTGSTATRKMITFARNARKWNK